MDHNRQVHILPRSQSQETDPTKVNKNHFDFSSDKVLCFEMNIIHKANALTTSLF